MAQLGWGVSHLAYHNNLVAWNIPSIQDHTLPTQGVCEHSYDIYICVCPSSSEHNCKSVTFLLYAAGWSLRGRRTWLSAESNSSKSSTVSVLLTSVKQVKYCRSRDPIAIRLPIEKWTRMAFALLRISQILMYWSCDIQSAALILPSLKTRLRLLNLIDSTLNSMLLTIPVSSQIFSKCCLTSVTVAIHQSRLDDTRWIWWCQNLTLTTERGISTNRHSLRVYILRCSVMYLYLLTTTYVLYRGFVIESASIWGQYFRTR